MISNIVGLWYRICQVPLSYNCLRHHDAGFLSGETNLLNLNETNISTFGSKLTYIPIEHLPKQKILLRDSSKLLPMDFLKKSFIRKKHSKYTVKTPKAAMLYSLIYLQGYRL